MSTTCSHRGRADATRYRRCLDCPESTEQQVKHRLVHQDGPVQPQAWSAIFAGISLFAAAVTIGSSWYLRWRDRPAAQWETSAIALQLTGPIVEQIAAIRPQWQVAITNVGDGIANQARVVSPQNSHAVFLVNDKSDARKYRFTNAEAIVQPGDTLVVLFDGEDGSPPPTDRVLTHIRRPVRHGKSQSWAIPTTHMTRSVLSRG